MRKKILFIIIGCIAIASAAYSFFSTGDSEQTIRILCIGFIFCILLSALRRAPERAAAGKHGFQTIHPEPAASTVSFQDIAANEEALSALRELVDYLKNPEKYARMGARMPRGILLYGPPGTGKTLLARALAGEAGVPLFPLSGSDFVEMYVGVGAGRVRDLFKKARRTGKCVIFIDEIDSLGKRRGDASSDEREQTLNALLSEMSGFREEDSVIVLAATNRLDSLDPALLRPGRFDRHIEVGLPGRDERLAILRLHSRNKPLSPSVDLDTLAANTVHFSGASLENLMNEAALAAARRNSVLIEESDIDSAYFSVIAGSDRPARGRREESASVALHEAGHAIASLYLTPENKIARISILPSSRGAGGYNLTVPTERMFISRDQILAQIQVLLAGRAAEMLISGSNAGLTSGASNDLARAAELASAMIMDLGMWEEPAVALRPLQKGCSAGVQDAVRKPSEKR